MVPHDQPLGPRKLRLLSIKRAKFLGLQKNGRGDVQKIERTRAKLRCAASRNLRRLSENFIAEGFRLEHSGANVFSEEL